MALAAAALGRRGDTSVARAFVSQPGVREGATPADTRAALMSLAGMIASPAMPRAVDAALEAADAAIAGAGALGATLVDLTDSRYSPWLAQITDPPLALWLRGRVESLIRPTVALVGSRDATPVGLSVARRLAAGLAEAGLVVASGLARGIDAAAHTGAVEAGGATIGVLGCGIDVVYPRGHAGLADRMVGQGAVITEFFPATPPLPSHFPLRNRIISGLSRAVVIVEASERSGSLITARLALEQNREVLAVPGGIASGRHRGCHALIKDGARLVETVGDILDALDLGRPRDAPAESSGKFIEMSSLEGMMAAGELYTLDDLASRTGKAPAELLSEIGRLEIAGRVSRAGGGCFVRLDGSAMDRE